MSNQLNNEYVGLIQENEGIIHKVIGLYVDDKEDRKDLFQEILLQAWKSYKNFKGQSKFSTWLYKVALNTALTFHKKESRQKELVNQESVQTTTHHEQRENHEMLYTLIKQINEVDRMLITLHLDGYKNTEIADIAGVTTNHVNVKIDRIKSKLIADFKNETNG